MTESQWTEADTKRAKEIWSAYQEQNDVTEKHGQAVGIDPISGRIWFGASAKEIAAQMLRSGLTETPLYFLRVGSDFYYRK
ncbi:hypothetical protein BH10PLA2_BH10PLA2_16190 [soil metagenome]